jgi:DNA polymerase-3 subunit alpha
MNSAFAHLRVHTEYSIVDGLVRLDDLVAAAAKDQQPALAVTDLGNLFGMVKFYKAARGKGIKPIIGADVWITNDEDRNNPSRLLLFAKNRGGYLNLCELLSRAWLENQYGERAEIRREWFYELNRAGRGDSLIALSGAGQGDIGMAVASGKIDQAVRCARRWAAIFPGHFYLEVQRYGQPNMESEVAETVALATELELPVVATHPVQFLNADEFIAHEARVCIAEGTLLNNGKRVRRFTQQQSFKSQAEMQDLFADLPAAIANTIEIAKRCNLQHTLGKPQLPNFPVPEGMTPDEFLIQQSQSGLEERLKHLYPDPERRAQERPRYDARLKFETDTIIKMRFPGYFLIVADFIQWAKNNGVPVGPGRGSGAGSLVAYSLLITDLDPLAYNLLFERFLNPERVSMPDFDIDFCQEGRDRVIQYVKERYGRDAVSQIATFGTMAAKGAVRDIGRVLDMSYKFADGISKLIPAKPGKHVTIADALEEEPVLAERQQNEEDVKQLLNLAQKVEGITRNIGMHAGGVLIAPGKLTDFCPLYTQDGETGVVSQYDKDDVEAVGLVKFDFLGLTTLTILDRAVRYIKALDPAMANFRLETLPMDDKPTYDLLVRAETVAVFQLESKGMQGMLKDAKPDRFEDIIALVALYRPGPMDLIPDFCKRKHGEKFDYPDPRTESILSETYGIMVYQEQVMQMAQIVGGYTLGGADMLRRAMGKKKPEEMAQHRELFRAGAAKDGLSTEKADEIFDLMEKFAGYGFNKSHAAAYALLSYHTAYLKCHHTAAFMAANLSLAMDDTDKVKVLYDDAVDVCGLSFLPPDVNHSQYRFTPVRPANAGEKPTQIRYGLGAVKGTGQNAIDEIVARRSEKPFTDLFDFCNRVDKKAVTRRTVDALIKAGAFDSLGTDRAILLASVELAFNGAQQVKAAANQGSLFGGEDELEPISYVNVPPWTMKERLAEEKTALGFYLSGHLFHAYAQESRFIARTRLADLAPAREPRLLAGVISGMRTQMTQRGKMVIITLDDSTAAVDVTIFSSIMEASRKFLIEDEYLVVIGKVAHDRFSGGLRVVAERVLDIETARVELARQVTFTIPEDVNAQQVKKVLETFRSDKGLPLTISRQMNGKTCKIAMPEQWKIVPADKMKRELMSLGIEDVCVEY